jgi:hypothetical protein
LAADEMTTTFMIILAAAASVGFLWAYSEFELYSWKAVLWLLLGGVALIGLLAFIKWNSTFLDARSERVADLTRFLLFQGFHGSRAMGALFLGYLLVFWSCIAAIVNTIFKVR